MANSDVKSKRLTGTGAASVGRSRLRQVQILTSSGGAGRLTLTDGNGGATILDIDFLASVNIFPNLSAFNNVELEFSICVSISSWTSRNKSLPILSAKIA